MAEPMGFLEPNLMKKVSNHIERPGKDVALKADNIAILDLTKVLALQEKYTTLQCECMRFADWVVNLTRDCHSVAIRFDDEYLDMAARQIAGNLRPKTAEEKEAERKKFSDAVNDAFNKTIGTELKK